MAMMELHKAFVKVKYVFWYEKPTFVLTLTCAYGL